VALLWFVAGAAFIAALVAWRQARTAARRLDQLTQMYWELKYQQGELRRAASGAAPAEPPVARPTESIIPLSSLKR
jgi:hypothetical protein